MMVTASTEQVKIKKLLVHPTVFSNLATFSFLSKLH